MHLQQSSAYTRVLKARLPADVHRPALSRLWWLPVHAAVIAGGGVCLSLELLPWSLAWLVSLPIGFSFAGLAFLAHEVLHGAIVHNRRLQHFVGWLAFLPFVLSPRLWIAWHNRVHHGSPNAPGRDPDAYPTLEEYASQRVVRLVTDHLGPGRHGLGTLIAIGIGFSVHSTNTLRRARKLNILSRAQWRWAIAETLLGVAIWLCVLLVVGGLPFLFGFVLPLLLANALVMGHILTNHTLSPHTEINDPLVNSLSVTVPRWFEWLTLGFGFHVEHHLYPWMSARHARAVRQLLLEHWPERYQSMPLSRALLELHRTARVYKNPTTLIDVKRRKEWSTLLPRAGLTSKPARAASLS